MTDIDQPLPVPQRRIKRFRTLAVALVALAVFAGGVYVVQVVQHAKSAASKSEAAAVKAEQAADLARAEVITSREQAYAGRAQVCRIQILLGAEPAGICLDPHVLAYYDPAEQRITPTFSCALWRGLHLPDIPADCEGR